MYSTYELIKVIETSIFDLAEHSSRQLRALPFLNVKYRCLDYSHPLANIVGAAQLNVNNVEGAIRAITTYFSTRQYAFSWRIGPYSSPADLGTRLLEHGFESGPEIKGMALSLENITENNLDKFLVRPAVESDIGLVENLIERAYPLPAEFASTLGGLFIELAIGDAFTLYLAFTRAPEICVGLGALYLSGDAIAVLPGAAVLPDFRKRGVYQQLLQHRMIEASKCGCEFVAMQAVADTSAPICNNMGFTELCSMDSYVWYPK